MWTGWEEVGWVSKRKIGTETESEKRNMTRHMARVFDT